MMSARRVIGALAGVALAAGSAVAVAPSASAAPVAKSHGTKSLAAVLTSDGNKFDRNWHDYDIVTEAVLAVLKAKPNSPVKVLADGKVALTAFIPNDRAFQILVADIAKKRLHSERAVFNAVAGLGIDTVESVLLYHVVPGATIDSKAAAKADKVRLKTALGSSIKVRVLGKTIVLVDADTNDTNPKVNRVDINKGNKQIAHGIDRVLRPINLP